MALAGWPGHFRPPARCVLAGSVSPGGGESNKACAISGPGP